MQTALGPLLIATRGWASAEAGAAYNRALELCQHLRETSQLAPTLYGLWAFHLMCGDQPMANGLAERLLGLARTQSGTGLPILANWTLGLSRFHIGDILSSRAFLEQGLANYNPESDASLAFLYGQDLGMSCLFYIALDLWLMGYPDQALERCRQGFAMAGGMSHIFGLAWALSNLALFHVLRREWDLAGTAINEEMALSSEKGFELYVASSQVFQGSLPRPEGHGHEVIAQMREGLTAWQRLGGGACSFFSLAGS